MAAASYVDVNDLRVDRVLYDFVNDEALPGSEITTAQFWRALSEIVRQTAPRHRELLATRERLQASIDDWHREHVGATHDPAAYREMLESIGYLAPVGPPFEIGTTGVDREIAEVAGPQLVVPATNARYALNAANSRWNSLYDAVYATDVLGDLPRPGPYDPDRGERVVAWVRAFLDDVVPLERGSYTGVAMFRIERGALVAEREDRSVTALLRPESLVGYRGEPNSPSAVLLRNHGLAIELSIDRAHPVGGADRAGIADVVLESALTTIVDLEDSVATVDGADKVVAYRNWLGLMRGDLTEQVTKGGRTFSRSLAPNRKWKRPSGTPLELPGRALLLVRNVGHLVTTPAVLDAGGSQIPEGIADAMISVLAARHDFARPAELRNSSTGSIYIVKPKMHGPDEVALTDGLFAAVERALDLPPDTIKVGIMDEERRTTVNLHECIRRCSLPRRLHQYGVPRSHG